MHSYFCIADLIVEIEHGELALPEEIYNFKIINSDYVDMLIKMDFTDAYNLTGDGYKCNIETALISIYESEDEYFVKSKNSSLVYGYRMLKRNHKGIIYLNPQMLGHCDLEHVRIEKRRDNVITPGEEYWYAIRGIFFFYAQKLGRIAVHAASILYEEKAYLFSASSGTGKSTHAEQWVKAGFACTHFNGDVAMCYSKDGEPMAASLPWCGTSGLYCNKIAPLGGILFLQRGEKDVVKPLTLAEGVLQCNARCFTPNWNRELVTRNLEVIEQFISKICFGELYCTPTTQAAYVAREYLQKGR